jgi:hypothetical protein
VAISTPSSTATPILDRLEPLPPLRGTRQLQITKGAIIGGVAAGVFLSFANLRAFLAPLDRALRAIVSRVEDIGVVQFAIVATLALFVAIALHEAGHAIAGWLVGFKVHSIRIWRLQLEIPFKLSIYRGPSGGAGGWAICTPGSTDGLATRAGLMLFAGPAVNLVSGPMVYWLAGAEGLFAFVFMLWSLVLGFSNLLPLRTGPLFSDGYRILMLLFDRRRGERWLALLTLSKDVLDGVSPDRFSEEFLAVATAVKDESSDTVSAHALAYSAAFRRRRYEEAAEYLEACLRYSSRTSAAFQQALMADAAVFQGRCRGNVDLAQAWLDNMPSKIAIAWHRLWAEAGVLQARGDSAGVLAKLDAIERVIRDQSSPHQKFALGSLERWRSDLAGSAESQAPTWTTRRTIMEALPPRRS